MTEFLSPAWIEALDAAASADPALAERTATTSLVIEQHVTGAPDGDVTYQVVVDRGRVRFLSGNPETATVRFTQDFETARSIASGEASAQRAFMAGALRVGGDVNSLVEHGPLLMSLGHVFDSVRATTEGLDPAAGEG